MINVYTDTVKSLYAVLQAKAEEDPCDNSNLAITPDTIVLGGFKKHFLPSSDGTKVRKAVAIGAFLSKESSLNVDHHWWRSLSPCDVTRLKAARIHVTKWMGSSVKNQDVYDNLNAGPGENFHSRKGDTSFYAKLHGKWSVTPSAAVDAAMGVMSFRLLRRYIANVNARILRAFRGNVPVADKQELFRRCVVDRFTLVRGDRATTVPKNQKTDRMIGVGPFWNVMFQKSVGSIIKEKLRVNLGYDIESMADTHRARMVSSEKISTIDFENASNSNSIPLVDYLFPTWLTELLHRYRSPEIRLPNGVWHAYRMLSPMGNGFTFEVMTVTLLALARTFDDNATVFGDDVIISDECAIAFCEFMERCTDFRVNHTKTFINHRLRESCGVFVLDNKRIERFDFKRIESKHDLHVTLNKLRRVIAADQISRSLRLLLCSLHVELTKYCTHYGPILEDLHGYYAEQAYYSAVTSARKARRLSHSLQRPVTYVKGIVRVTTSTVISQSSREDLGLFVLLRRMAIPTRYNRNINRERHVDIYISEGHILSQDVGAVVK